MNLVVLGMHRSGTSMLAGLLEQASYYVGSQVDLLEKGEQNLKGFYERKDIRAVNDEILRENFFDWNLVAGYSATRLSSDSISTYQSKMDNILNSLVSQTPWLIKEPRLCLLYPLLRNSLQNCGKIVIYRDPFSTARSLWKRNRIPFQFGLLIWEKYYTSLINELCFEEKVYVVRYESLISSPESEVQKLLVWLRKEGQLDIASEVISNAVNFIDNKLNRSSSSIIDDGMQALSENQQLIIQLLANYNTNGFSKIPESKYLDVLLEQNQLLYMEFGRLQLENEEIIDLKRRLSWELTKPLRYLGDSLPRVAKHIDKAVRQTVKTVKLMLFASRRSKNAVYWDIPDQIESSINAYIKNKRANNKIAVVTANYGGYDKLSIPYRLENTIDYICFTDSPIESYGVWQIRQSPYYNISPTRMARYVKLHLPDLLNEYETLIWIDGNIIIRGDLLKYVHLFETSDSDISLISHPLRNCLYQEAKACIERNKDNADDINKQINHYRNIGVPRDSGLFETNFFITSNSPQSKRFFNIWWREIERFTKRDQLSIVVAQRESGINYSHILPKHLSVRNNKDFKIVEHSYMRHFALGQALSHLQKVGTPSSMSSPFKSYMNDEIARVSEIKIDIVVCVHNALDDVKKCLQSVVEHKSVNESLIIVNDKSDIDTTTFLTHNYGDLTDVKLIHNDENIGYIKSANIGMQTSDADLVILLNSDTVVAKNWARKLTAVAFSSNNIGIVGPLSNAAGYQSIPDIKRSADQTAINVIPEHVTYEALNELCEKSTDYGFYPRVPLVHGFCFAIKREVMKDIGYFDEINFQKYYGEENDYCFRARKLGFELAIATNTFIYHSKSKSISESERIKYMGQAGAKLRELHGEDEVNIACEQMEKHPLLIHLRHKAQSWFTM